MDNTITIVTVVYNDKNNIEKTINSVLNQSYNSKEYIVVDGKSTDGTLEIVKKYADQISVIVSEPDRGIYDAMNKAVDLAHNEWIIFMNSGDVFADNDTLKNVFNEPISKNISFIYSDFIVSNDSWKKKFIASYENGVLYNPQIQISAESETKRSIFREKDKTKRSKKESAQHSKSRNKSFVMTSVSAL